MRHLDIIDFNILICGRICWDEIDRVKRVCRLSAIKIPVFMQNMVEYVSQLQQIAETNKIRLASTHNNGWPTEDEIRKTREELLDDIHGYGLRTLDYRTILAHSKCYGGDKRMYYHDTSKSVKWIRQQSKKRCNRPPSPKSSTRDELISALSATHLFNLDCEEKTAFFIEFDLRHPIVNRKDYENVTRD